MSYRLADFRPKKNASASLPSSPLRHANDWQVRRNEDGRQLTKSQQRWASGRRVPVAFNTIDHCVDIKGVQNVR